MFKHLQTRVSEIFRFANITTFKLPLYISKVSAGFPSPADDFIDKKLDLNEFLIEHPVATFFVRASGNSMIGAGIHSGDILIVDRALEAGDNKIVIAILNGDLTVKRIRKQNDKLFLVADNPQYRPIEITEEHQFEVWGVVTYVIHSVKR